ncbi:MAG: hypothetical protein ACU85E_17145 [Gammaproteobacteria bacterium]
MKKCLLEIYSLAICFFTVGCFVIVLGMTLWDVVELSAPEFTLDNHSYEIHQSDEAFRESLINACSWDGSNKTISSPPEGQSLTEARENSYAKGLRSEHRSALQNLVKYLIILLVDLGVFVAHWKIGAHARRNTG